MSHIERDEFQALLDACDDSPAGIRDRALLWLAWSNGLRRGTLASLKIQDIKGDTIQYTAKGDKRGTAYLLGSCLDAVKAWLKLRGRKHGALFSRIAPSGKVFVSDSVSGQAVSDWLNKRIDLANVDELTMHDFRRTFAGNLLDEGYDITTVQRLMLHESPTTTARYDRRSERHALEAVQTLSE